MGFELIEWAHSVPIQCPLWQVARLVDQAHILPEIACIAKSGRLGLVACLLAH